MSEAPPGWYPDPGAPAGVPPLMRWWDGVRWTEHLQHPPRPVGRPPGPTSEDGQPLAGWWWRVLAWVIDSAITGIVSGIVTLPAQIDIQRRLLQSQTELERRLEAGQPVDPVEPFRVMMDAFSEQVIWLLVVPTVLALAYHAGMLRWRGATVGKLAAGLRVRPVERDGRLSWSQIAVRVGVQQVVPWLAYLVVLMSGSPAAFFLGGLLIFVYTAVDALWATRAHHRAVHDLAARTVVVKRR